MRDTIQSNPEKYGFTLIAELEFGGSYDFDTHLVFMNHLGLVYYVQDSGCSCPTPFDDINGVDDMELITLEGFEGFRSHIMGLPDGTIGEKHNFVQMVKAVL